MEMLAEEEKRARKRQDAEGEEQLRQRQRRSEAQEAFAKEKKGEAEAIQRDCEFELSKVIKDKGIHACDLSNRAFRDHHRYERAVGVVRDNIVNLDIERLADWPMLFTLN